MRRSEVVNKIKESLISRFLTCSEVTRNQCKNEAEYILIMLEELGMLPPYRAKTEEEKEQVDAINQYNYCHRWEKE